MLLADQEFKKQIIELLDFGINRYKKIIRIHIKIPHYAYIKNTLMKMFAAY